VNEVIKLHISLKCRVFLDHQSEYQLLKRDSALEVSYYNRNGYK
jgi:hypothetical protein